MHLILENWWFYFSIQIINTYTEAVQTVDPQLASGKLHTLWVAFAKYYEDAGQIDDVSYRIYCCNLSWKIKLRFLLTYVSKIQNHPYKKRSLYKTICILYTWKTCNSYCRCNINGFVQGCSISIANVLAILQSCTKPSMWNWIMKGLLHSCCISTNIISSSHGPVMICVIFRPQYLYHYML